MISHPLLVCFGVLEQHVDRSFLTWIVCMLASVHCRCFYIPCISPGVHDSESRWKARWDLRKICAAFDKSLQWTTEPQHSQHHKTAWKFLYVCHTPLQGRRASSWMSSQLLEKWHKLLSSRLWSAFYSCEQWIVGFIVLSCISATSPGFCIFGLSQTKSPEIPAESPLLTLVFSCSRRSLSLRSLELLPRVPRPLPLFWRQDLGDFLCLFCFSQQLDLQVERPAPPKELCSCKCQFRILKRESWASSPLHCEL